MELANLVISNQRQIRQLALAVSSRLNIYGDDPTAENKVQLDAAVTMYESYHASYKGLLEAETKMLEAKARFLRQKVRTVAKAEELVAYYECELMEANQALEGDRLNLDKQRAYELAIDNHEDAVGKLATALSAKSKFD